MALLRRSASFSRTSASSGTAELLASPSAVKSPLSSERLSTALRGKKHQENKRDSAFLTKTSMKSSMKFLMKFLTKTSMKFLTKSSMKFLTKTSMKFSMKFLRNCLLSQGFRADALTAHFSARYVSTFLAFSGERFLNSSPLNSTVVCCCFGNRH
jgi:hypothetical protein